MPCTAPIIMLTALCIVINILGVISYIFDEEYLLSLLSMTTFFVSLLWLFHIVLYRMCSESDYMSVQIYVSKKTKYFYLGICTFILGGSWALYLFDIRTSFVKFLTGIITLPWWFYIFKYEICTTIPSTDQDIELLPGKSVISLKDDNEGKFTIGDEDFGIEKKTETKTEPDLIPPRVTRYNFVEEEQDTEDGEDVVTFIDDTRIN